MKVHSTLPDRKEKDSVYPKPVGEVLVPSMTSQTANSTAFLFFQTVSKGRSQDRSKGLTFLSGEFLSQPGLLHIISNDFE